LIRFEQNQNHAPPKTFDLLRLCSVAFKTRSSVSLLRMNEIIVCCRISKRLFHVYWFSQLGMLQ